MVMRNVKSDPDEIVSAGDVLVRMVAWIHDDPGAEFYRQKKKVGIESPLFKSELFAERMAQSEDYHGAARKAATRKPTEKPADDVIYPVPAFIRQRKP